MTALPFDRPPCYRPRRFVPEQAKLDQWETIAPLFDTLQSRAPACDSVQALEAWLVDWNELSAALDEEGCLRSIAKSSHTDSPEAEKAYLFFIEQIEPQVKPRQFALEKLLVEHPLRSQLPRPRYEVLLRDARNRVELYRPENVELEKEETKVAQEYMKLCGSLTVTLGGEEFTLDQMSARVEEPARAVREEAWRLVAGRRLQEYATFDAQFDSLLDLRQRMARNAGFENYRDYAFRRMGRFDYTPADCEAFHEAIATEVMPVVLELQAKRRASLGLDSLRPWDLSVEPDRRPPLRPYETTDQLIAGTQKIFDQLDPELATRFRHIHELRLLDLESRPAKAPGAYQCTLAEARLAFISLNGVGQQFDVQTLLHESGHAFHALAAREDSLLAYRQLPQIEFAELASMSMEMLGNAFIEAFYTPEDANRARATYFERLLVMLGHVALGDAFQHWLYTHPHHTPAERSRTWEALLARFTGDVDWSCLEEIRPFHWHRILHFFLVPFYYVEYGMAQLGALQVWANYRRNPSAALAAYKKALALGASRPLPESYATAGCEFRFDAAMLRELVALVRRELECSARLDPIHGHDFTARP